jgi:hypothetical protein
MVSDEKIETNTGQARKRKLRQEVKKGQAS